MKHSLEAQKINAILLPSEVSYMTPFVIGYPILWVKWKKNILQEKAFVGSVSKSNQIIHSIIHANNIASLTSVSVAGQGA